MKTPTPKEMKDTRTAINMLICIKLLPTAMLDLVSACEDSRIFRQDVKYTINQVLPQIQVASDMAHQIFIGIDPKIAHNFLQRSDEALSDIDDQIKLQGVDRATNVVISLLGLAGEFVGKIRPTYDFAYANQLEAIKTRLAGAIPYQEEPIIKFVIRNIVKELKIEVA